MNHINRNFLFFLLMIPMQFLSAQDATLKGTVKDAKNGEALIGVNIVSGTHGTTTDFDGNYTFELPAGTHAVEFKYIGYETKIERVTLAAGEVRTLNVNIGADTRQLNIVVVSASKFEKPLSEETVSIEVLRPDLIESANAIDIEEAMGKVPSVTVVEGQANIRGGSGWSYGAGSRVLVLVDDIPALSADAADAKWSTFPLENLEQVEVLKGAASALYGSSALNGIINVRTAWPRNEPYTKVTLFNGIWTNPDNERMAWWGRQQPFFSGGWFAHRQKFGQLDLVLGGQYYGEKSYLQDGGNHQGRLNIKTRYRFKNIEGLSIGLSTNVYRSFGSTYFIWGGNDSLAYTPMPNTTSNYVSTRITVDPFITYLDNKNNRFSLKGRWFNATNTNDTEQGSVPDLYFGEFQYGKEIPSIEMNIVTGISGYYSSVKSPTGNPEESLIGEHTGDNLSGYLQLDKKFFGRLSLAAGVRYETFRIDTMTGNSGLVGRLGANLQLAEYTFFRASAGQGYRFPTMAELYVRTSVGAVNIYPNPKLEPERGWSAEVGIKQGVQVGEWRGFVDLAGFINEYTNMMEFTFGQFGLNKSSSNLFGLGFSSQNIGNTRIIGGDFSIMGQGAIFGLPVSLLTGYTYIVPQSLNWNDTLRVYNEAGEFISLGTTYAQSSESEENILKYRHEHTVKFDMEVEIKKFDFGVGFQYLSYMKNIDNVFVSPLFISFEPSFGSTPFSGLKTYREMNEGRGTSLLEARCAFNVNENFKLSLIVKNLLNNEYMIRPALMGEPRSFTVQMSYLF